MERVAMKSLSFQRLSIDLELSERVKMPHPLSFWTAFCSKILPEHSENPSLIIRQCSPLRLVTQKTTWYEFLAQKKKLPPEDLACTVMCIVGLGLLVYYFNFTFIICYSFLSFTIQYQIHVMFWLHLHILLNWGAIYFFNTHLTIHMGKRPYRIWLINWSVFNFEFYNDWHDLQKSRPQNNVVF